MNIKPFEKLLFNATKEPFCEYATSVSKPIIRNLEGEFKLATEVIGDTCHFTHYGKGLKPKEYAIKYVEACEPYKSLLVKKGDKQVISKNFREYLNNEELEAFNDYFETYGHNRGLRDGEPLRKDDLLMLSGFKKAPALEQDAVVYRGVERLRFKSSQNFIDSIEKGTIIDDPGFMSTSTNLVDIKNTIFIHNAINSDGLIIRIHLPKGTRGVLMDYNEYLLPLNSKLLMKDVEKINGLKIVDAEYILPE